MRLCPDCNQNSLGIKRKYCDECALKRRKAHRVNMQRRKRKLLTQKAIDYKGGKCILCGYNRCNRALDFHHVNPEEKEFDIARNGCTRAWETTKRELDKCVLLCSNCHREVEDGFTVLNIPT